MPQLGGFDINYPQPPQQPQGFLSGNPANTIDMLGGLQRLQILQQQAPALEQQSAATLQGSQIQNQTARIQQQDLARRTLMSTTLGLLQPKIDPKSGQPIPPTGDDVSAALASAARLNPEAASMGVGGGIQQALMQRDANGKLDIGANMRSARVSLLSPAEASQMVTGPYGPGGEETTIPQSEAIMRGSYATKPPAGSGESATQYRVDQQKAANFPQEMYPWTQALQKLKELGPGATGPGSEGRQALEEYVYGLAPSIAPYLGVDASKIKNYSDMRKYLVQGMQQRANSMGPHTNEGLSVATTGSPNVNINDMSVDELIKSQIIMRRMEQAQIGQAAQVGPIRYGDEKARIAGQQDPRVYGMDLMDPKDRDNYIKSLKGQARANAQTSLQAAYNSGVMTRPGQ